MSSALAATSGDFGLALHGLLRDLDTASWRSDLEGSARRKLDEIEADLRAILNGTWPDSSLDQLQARLHDIQLLLAEYAPDTGGDQWIELREQLQPAYEALASTLRAEAIHLPRLRPTNYRRNVLHVGMALGIILLVEYALNPQTMILVSGGGGVWALSMEISRRFSPRINRFLMIVFGPFAHPHETHRVNSATWYTLSLLLLAVSFTPAVCVAALAVLGLGDPMAAIIGRRFGKFELINGRTLEGSIAFILTGACASMAALLAWHADMGLTAIVVLSLSAATAGSIAELLVRRIDDNFAIPVAGAAAGSLALMFL